MIDIPQIRENYRKHLERYSHPSIVIWYWSPVADIWPVSTTCDLSVISSRIYEKLIGYSQQIDSSKRMELCIPVSFGLMSAQPNLTVCLSYNWCMTSSSRIRQSVTDVFWNALELLQSCTQPYVEQIYENQITFNLLILDLMVSETGLLLTYFYLLLLRWTLRTKIVYVMSQILSI